MSVGVSPATSRVPHNWLDRQDDNRTLHFLPRNGAEIGPVFAFFKGRGHLQLRVCTKLARSVRTSRPESRSTARRGITGITWDERRPATGYSPRTRDQATQLW